MRCKDQGDSAFIVLPFFAIGKCMDPDDGEKEKAAEIKEPGIPVFSVFYIEEYGNAEKQPCKGAGDKGCFFVNFSEKGCHDGKRNKTVPEMVGVDEYRGPGCIRNGWGYVKRKRKHWYAFCLSFSGLKQEAT